MIKHEQDETWRVIGRGNRWQTQNYVSTEHGNAWWDIGPVVDTKEKAIATIYMRKPLAGR